MPEIEVPGAVLHYEVSGTGPLILCISGANGSFETWVPLAQHLKHKNRVASYDRRGFSRSVITGPQDYEHRLDIDADDVAALIKHLSPDEPAIVMGSSSGAIVSLQVLLRHSSLVRLLIPHEPPAVKLNPNPQELMDQQRAIYDLYRSAGPFPAMGAFFQFCKVSEEERASFTSRGFDFKADPYVFSNIQYWFEREFKVYPFADFTTEMFQPHKEKLMPVNSVITAKDSLQYLANVKLAKDLGLGEVKDMAGGHVGYASHAADYAKDLMKMLEKRGM